MADQVNMGNKDMNIEDLSSLWGVKPSGEVTETGEPLSTKDILIKSERIEQKGASTEGDKPVLETPSEDKVNGASQQIAAQEIKTNPWFKPSFLAAFYAAVLEFLNIQSQVHFKESQAETTLRGLLLEMARTAAAVQKAITLNQAQEQLVQAISSFLSAAVSTAQFLHTARNMNTAKTEVGNEIEAQEGKLKDAIQAHGKGADRIEAIDPNDMHPAIKTEQQKLKDMMDRKETRIQDKMTHLDRQVQYLGEGAKSTLQGASGVMTGMIKISTAYEEEFSKMLDGYIQALNKLSETTSRNRDEYASNYSKFIDFLMKIIESDFKAHMLSGR